jgi:hypothetical protein
VKFLSHMKRLVAGAKAPVSDLVKTTPDTLAATIMSAAVSHVTRVKEALHVGPVQSGR